MTHRTDPKYWDYLNALPEEVRELAYKNYDLLQVNPDHPSLAFKRIGSLWSVRVGLHYRALGRDEDPDVVWFWIGHHSVYDRMITAS